MGGAKVLAPISMRELAVKTHYPFATIQRLMQDLIALQIVKRVGAGVASTWTLSEYVRKEVEEAELYTDEDMTTHPVGRIRLLRKVKKKRATKSDAPVATDGAAPGKTPGAAPPVRP